MKECLLAATLVGLVLGGLLVGYEPVGGDPERMYRPLKVELARALQAGRLPFWSDAIGLGVPLAAESHVAAFYPPNLVAYRLLPVPVAYRWLMWLHGIALAALTCLYARSIGIGSWGSALAGVVFALCGFQAVHASHEPLYTAMPYLPLSLWMAGRYASTGRLAWIPGLALVLGAQWTIGHFQIPMWTGGLVLATGFWRVAADRLPRRRLAGLVLAVGWGMLVAAVQLALSAGQVRAAQHMRRSVAELTFFSFPPSHWVELAIPRLFRGLVQGPEDPYWFRELTTGHEALFYVGTIPLILALVGLCDTKRREGQGAVWFWRLALTASLLLATMPRWWLPGYAALLRLPGIGYFRAPARYTLIASFALALLAGQGLDQTLARSRFRVGVSLAVVFALAAFGYAFTWSDDPGFRSAPGFWGLPFGMAPALLAWGLGLAVLSWWRRGGVGAWLPIAVCAVELGILYHQAPTNWGWAVHLPEESPVLAAVAKGNDVGRVGGVVDNLPLRAGRMTASTYLGMAQMPINVWLRTLQERDTRHDAGDERWLQRLGVTHTIWDAPVPLLPGQTERTYRDPVLDEIAYCPPGLSRTRVWHVVTHGPAFPEARAARGVAIEASRNQLLAALGARDDRDLAHALREDLPPGIGPSSFATHADVASWNCDAGVVTHDGPCVLILTRTFDPGWNALLDDGRLAPTFPVDGGLLGIYLEGRGASRVRVSYTPTTLAAGVAGSAVGLAAALLCLFASWLRRGTGGS